MSHPAMNDKAVEAICEILRRYAMDAQEAIENDDLIFEADYANAILELPELADFTTPDPEAVTG